MVSSRICFPSATTDIQESSLALISTVKLLAVDRTFPGGFEGVATAESLWETLLGVAGGLATASRDFPAETAGEGGCALLPSPDGFRETSDQMAKAMATKRRAIASQPQGMPAETSPGGRSSRTSSGK